MCFRGDWCWPFLSNLLNLAWNLPWTHYEIEEGGVHSGGHIYTWNIWNFMLSVPAIAHQVLYKTHTPRVHRDRYLGSCALPFFMVVNWGGFLIFLFYFGAVCGILPDVLSTSGFGRKGELQPLPCYTLWISICLSESGIICISGILRGPILEARSAAVLQSWLFQD